jgi:lysozyme
VKTSERGQALIRKFEGCKLKAYKCPADVWTIGYGHTGAEVKEGCKITKAEATELLAVDLEKFEAQVLAALGNCQVTQGQFDALVSFTYNLGVGRLKESTLLKLLKAGQPRKAADQFLLWTRAAGKVLPGLVTRRDQERILFLS